MNPAAEAKSTQRSTQIVGGDPVVVPYVGQLGHEQIVQLGYRAGGVILKGRKNIKEVRLLRQSGYKGMVLLDPADYEKRAYSADSLEELEAVEGWIGLQENLGVDAILSPTPYIPLSARELLEQYLETAQRLQQQRGLQLVIVLPLDGLWLTQGLEELLRIIDRTEIPLGLVLGHRTNPLGSIGAVRGLATLLAQHSNIFMLRTDLSGIGGVAHGSLGASVGISSSLRHVVPPGEMGGGNRDDRSPNVAVEALLSYLKGSKIESAQGRARDLFDCNCQVCDGASLERFGDPAFKSEAHAHSIEIALRIARRVTDAKLSLQRGLWRQMCAEAIQAHQELQERISIRFAPPADLIAWERAHFSDIQPTFRK